MTPQFLLVAVTVGVRVEHRGEHKAAVVRIAKVFQNEIGPRPRVALARVAGHGLPAFHLHEVEAAAAPQTVLRNRNSIPGEARVKAEVTYTVRGAYHLQKFFCCQVVQVQKGIVPTLRTKTRKSNQASGLVGTDMTDEGFARIFDGLLSEYAQKFVGVQVQ